MELKEKAIQTIKRHSMLQEGDAVLIGLSGGPDSVCLSVILEEVRDNFNLSLHALYVDHGLRPEESRDEETFCEGFCDEYGIDFHSEKIEVKAYAEESSINIHEAARELRYDAFERTALKTKASKIAVAHNADDQSETVLMRLVRGAGRRGLSGIPYMRGNIIRPLLDIRREDIEKFLSEKQIQFVTDSSNLKTEYLRNRLRQEIIPILRKDNPSVTDSINRTADILREEERYLDIATTRTMMRLITRKTDESIELFLTPLMTIDRAILRRVLKRALSEIGADRGIELTHVDGVIHLIKDNRSGDMINLPKEIRAVKSYSTLLLTKEVFPGLQTQYIDVPGETLIGEKGLTIISQLSDKAVEITNRDAAVFDFERLVLPLQLRKRREGDFFYPAGFGRRKKLQDFFVDEKVPREERDSVPIIVSGEDIIWVAGYRADDRFKVTDRTEKCLRLIISKRKS
ncbi:MAG: tRNA lysidine(34) synthetase TilS [Nitrospiraceae bacterium]|nr:MAG: tRNA lysidine(34) synthetase TilS [Nitrospiraceae bacterium]